MISFKRRSYRILTRACFTALALALGPGPVAGASAQQPAASTIDPASWQALKWRNVGPWRGGRVTAVAGAPSAPHTFYMGATGGGVWRTTDAGASWQNISDGFFNTGTIGAIAVARSDPKVIYVGTGEAPIRGVSTADGDGMYKSTDGGETWTHIGLEATRHIAIVVVDPNDADTVWVGAQGNAWVASEERGVYKSTDGGKTWRRTLFVNPSTGVHDLSQDAHHPDILYAGTWDHQRTPWTIRSGGPGGNGGARGNGGEGGYSFAVFDRNPNDAFFATLNQNTLNVGTAGAGGSSSSLDTAIPGAAGQAGERNWP